MRFEYDIHKSAMNKLKHGINFEEAKLLWNDPEALEIPLRYEGESRFAVLGKFYDKHWTAIITYRDNAIRIISVRRARKNEVYIYENC